jgi:hypothetical protein
VHSEKSRHFALVDGLRVSNLGSLLIVWGDPGYPSSSTCRLFDAVSNHRTRITQRIVRLLQACVGQGPGMWKVAEHTNHPAL